MAEEDNVTASAPGEISAAETRSQDVKGKGKVTENPVAAVEDDDDDEDDEEEEEDGANGRTAPTALLVMHITDLE